MSDEGQDGDPDDAANPSATCPLDRDGGAGHAGAQWIEHRAGKRPLTLGRGDARDEQAERKSTAA